MQQPHGQNELVGVCLQLNTKQNLVHQKAFNFLEGT